jgi:hypothetical protein
MPLKSLYVYAPNIADLKPLHAMKLEDIRLTPRNITQGLEMLRDMKSLKTIGLTHYDAWPAAEFWDRLGKGEFNAKVDAPKPTSPWTVLKATEMKSDGGATLKLLDDRSVLVSGNHPDNDVYTLTVRELPAGIHSLRLEALTNDALPNKGPGRHPVGDFTFVLSTIKAELVPSKGPPLPLKFARAWGDHEPLDANPGHAIDADDGTGWSATTGESHYAVFELEKPVEVTEGAVLRVTLEFKHPDAQRELGCFRLSATKDKPPQPSK